LVLTSTALSSSLTSCKFYLKTLRVVSVCVCLYSSVCD
jgi:hypothetical protein